MTATQPLTRRLAAHPIAVRLARLGYQSLAAAGVEGGFASGLRFDVTVPKVAA